MYISGGFRMSATTDSVIDGASMVLLLETLLDDSKIMRKTQDEKRFDLMNTKLSYFAISVKVKICILSYLLLE